MTTGTQKPSIPSLPTNSTTKLVGEGTGMGLSSSYQIITQKHSGKLTFASSPDVGTEFVIQIPLTQS